VLVTLFLPKGIAGLLGMLKRRRGAATEQEAAA
jgi:hypothetical protein